MLWKNLWSLNFKQGDDARSVLSPAAYLADLLQLLDDNLSIDTQSQAADCINDGLILEIIIRQ
jgi:hypothetical protein